jgi:biotin transport system substrate-specific component
MQNARVPFVTYDSSLVDHVGVGAESALAVRVVRAAAVLFVTVLTAAAAQVSVPLPFTPVPFTIQPLIVLVGAAAIGARLGAVSQLLYLMLGVIGLPVFAASPVLFPGVARLLGPTGGFLLAYPLAALATGWLAGRGFDRRYASSVVAMLVGLAIIYAGGVTWLAWLMPSPWGLDAALASAFYPFILADLVKVGAAAVVLPTAWAMLGWRASTRA